MDIHAQPVNYPYAIFRACSELPYQPAFSDMPDGYIRVVFRIIQKINLSKPTSEIFASRGTLAEESGKSLDSVHRVISWLEKKGFIQRERVARFGLRGSKSPLVPTLTFLQSLGLLGADGKPKYQTQAQQRHIDAAEQLRDQDSYGHDTHHGKSNLARGPSPFLQAIGMIDSDGNSLIQTQSNTEQMHSAAGEKSSPTPQRTIREKSDFVRVGKVFLPSDLAWMCTTGLSAFAVLKLMKTAQSAQQKLSDVVAASRKYLNGLPGQQLYAYLQALLRSGRDFSGILDESTKVTKDARNRAHIAEKAEIYAGRTFISKADGTLYRVEAGGGIRVEKDGKSMGMRPFTQAFLDSLENGKILAW